MPLIVSHVDVRVRDRVAAAEFYDAFLNLLGAVKRVGEEFTTWRIPPPDAGDDWDFWVVETSSYQATDLAASPPVTIGMATAGSASSRIPR